FAQQQSCTPTCRDGSEADMRISGADVPKSRLTYCSMSSRKERRRLRSSIRSRDAEFNSFLERELHGRVREQSKRVLRDRAVVAGALDRVVERAVLDHQRDGLVEIGVGGVTLFERAAPECPLGLEPATIGEHDRQRDLPFAEVVAHVLAE